MHFTNIPILALGYLVAAGPVLERSMPQSRGTCGAECSGSRDLQPLRKNFFSQRLSRLMPFFS